MKFGKKLERTVKRMPLEHREQLFLDYKMLKRHIKRLVNARKTPISEKPPLPHADQLHHYHNDLLECPLAVSAYALAFGVADQSITREADVQDVVNDDLPNDWIISWPITATATACDVENLDQPLSWEGVEGWKCLEAAWPSISGTDSVLVRDNNVILHPKKIRFRMANLSLDILILHYCSRINYEAAVKILKKYDKRNGSDPDLRWSYLHHVEAQRFCFLAPQILDSANHCRDLMSLGTIQPLSLSEEQWQLLFNKLGDKIFKLLDAGSLAVEMESSTSNAQSFNLPATMNS